MNDSNFGSANFLFCQKNCWSIQYIYYILSKYSRCCGYWHILLHYHFDYTVVCKVINSIGTLTRHVWIQFSEENRNISHETRKLTWRYWNMLNARGLKGVFFMSYLVQCPDLPKLVWFIDITIGYIINGFYLYCTLK